MALIKTTSLAAALLFLVASPPASARMIQSQTFPDDMFQLVHCTGANGRRTTEMWRYSNRKNAVFGKPDLFTENLSASHIAFEGETWPVQNLTGPSPGGFFIAEGAGSTNPGTLVGAGNFAPSACYRGNGSPQSDGNGRQCQLLYNCYLEPDIVLEYTVGRLLENTTENWGDFPAANVGLLVQLGQIGGGINDSRPFPPNAQHQYTYPRGSSRLVTVAFHNDGDISGALSRLVLAGLYPRGDAYDIAWCHAWGGCEDPAIRFLRFGSQKSTAMAPQSLAVNAVQGEEKTNGAGLTVDIVNVPQAGKPDCTKFNGLASGILGLLGTVAADLSVGVGAGLAAISGSLGVAASVCAGF
ncbi:hypothetical protein HK104_011188 [Borealophlyctis nickersoniae]|nr:hypothetical protein HK104_011188 [Borealophlyctis nickersoniae]